MHKMFKNLFSKKPTFKEKLEEWLSKEEKFLRLKLRETTGDVFDYEARLTEILKISNVIHQEDFTHYLIDRSRSSNA